jgi:hypothetical protein
MSQIDRVKFQMQRLCCRPVQRCLTHLAAILLPFSFFASVAGAADSQFAKGTQTWTLSGGYTTERTGESTYLANATIARGFYFLDNAAFDVQVPIYFAHDDEIAGGFGLQALARYHFLNVQRFSLYADILGGILWTSDDFPTGGTEFNFTYAGGPGASYRMTEHAHLLAGFRFQHVSNGFIEGRDRNPILNSLGGYVGVMWTF